VGGSPAYCGHRHTGGFRMRFEDRSNAVTALVKRHRDVIKAAQTSRAEQCSPCSRTRRAALPSTSTAPKGPSFRASMCRSFCRMPSNRSASVNDFICSGKTFRVTAQATRRIAWT